MFFSGHHLYPSWGLIVKKKEFGRGNSCILGEKNGNLFIMNIETAPPKDRAISLVKIDQLLSKLSETSSVTERLDVIDKCAEVKQLPSVLESLLSECSTACQYVVKATFVIGQGAHLFSGFSKGKEEKLHELFDQLIELENLYTSIGGIIGYQHLVLRLLSEETQGTDVKLHPPKPIDLREQSSERDRAVIEGIVKQDQMIELYPVGGAADRLQLKDENTQEGLPAARLVFLGRHLLEGMVDDLEAREYLHYKLFGKQVTTPIAMMTSSAHNNDKHIRDICAENHWFGRKPDSFRFFMQPPVPTFTKEGKWCLKGPLELLSKPGGHGMIWNLAEQSGVFDWAKKHGKTTALVRQINNPMAGVDDGLLAFLGMGHLKDKLFGFAACPRLENAQEGMNVIRESVHDGCRRFTLTNIEYCDFQRLGATGETFASYPANTNILFANLEAARKTLHTTPYPGLLLNFREGSHYNGQEHRSEQIARVESTMQNLADSFEVAHGDKNCPDLPTYLTVNVRRKTLSSTKRLASPEAKLRETPEACYSDHMENVRELLSSHCKMQLPETPFLFRYHPALGPLYQVIGQKVSGGKLHQGAELRLDIADLELSNLEIEGSLLIEADNVTGHLNSESERVYSSCTGQCSLKNVRVKNAGIDWDEEHLFWKDADKRSGCLKIVLHGHSRFVAENVTFNNSRVIEVPDGILMTAQEKEGKVAFNQQPLHDDHPFWNYQVDSSQKIKITR